MSEWIELDPEQLNKSRTQEIQGVQVNVFLSPYDVPDGVRGYYDPKIRRFVVEFRYIGGAVEPLVPDAEDEGNVIRLKVGRNSQRLYRIEIDTDRLNAQHVALNVAVPDQAVKAIDSLKARARRASREGNYEVAKEIISQRSSELLESLS